MSSAASSRRSRSRAASNLLYRAPGHEGFEAGVIRVNQRDTSLGLTHRVEPSEARTLPATMAEIEAEFDQPLPDLPIPASGDPYHDCGEEQPLKFCERCGKPKRVPRRCRRAVCPECWESWAGKQAVEIAAKINGRQRYENTGPGNNWWMHHVTFSPPPGYQMRVGDPLDQTYEIGKQILGEGGAFEGAMTYHPYRIKPEYRGQVLGHDSGEGNLQWRHILHMVEIVGWEAVKDEFLVFEPHFHAFVLSPYFHMDTSGFQEQSGWIVERISDESGASVKELDDLVAAVAYSLTHAGGREGEDRYRYFGETANFEASEGVKADARRALVAVSDRVLGVGVGGGGGCGQDLSELIEANDGEPLNAPSGGGGGEPPEAVDLDEDREQCGGREVPMSTASDYLTDEEWLDGAPFASDLAVAHSEFQALRSIEDRPPPDPPPD